MNKVDVDKNSSTTPVPSYKVTFSLDDDKIKCEKGDVLTAALVTDMVTFNSHFYDDEQGKQCEEISLFNHHIRFIELGEDDEQYGKYDYEVPYCISNKSDVYDYFAECCVSTSACQHTVRDSRTSKVRLEIDYYRSVVLTHEDMDNSSSYLYGVLVEKNV